MGKGDVSSSYKVKKIVKIYDKCKTHLGRDWTPTCHRPLVRPEIIYYCSETTLTGESRFHISTPQGI
jgi:hypothetical protein